MILLLDGVITANTPSFHSGSHICKEKTIGKFRRHQWEPEVAEVTRLRLDMSNERLPGKIMEGGQELETKGKFHCCAAAVACMFVSYTIHSSITSVVKGVTQTGVRAVASRGHHSVRKGHVLADKRLSRPVDS